MAQCGKRIFRLLPAALERPSDGIVEQLNASLEVLKYGNWEAELHLSRFRDFCIKTPLTELEQIYDRTFGSDAPCSPFVGHHILGHDQSRRLFSVKVRQEYQIHFDPRSPQEPDHIAMMLRSLVVQESVEEARDLMVCCLIPAAEKMLALLGDRNPYRHVLRAVLVTLQTEERPASAARERRCASVS